MITASGAADTLRLLIPGLVALKVVYYVGLRTKRSDLEWTLWSLLVAVFIDLVITLAVPGVDTTWRLVDGLGLAVVGGSIVGIGLDALVRRFPRVRAEASRTVWDELWGQLRVDPRWVQVWSADGKIVVSGQSLSVSGSAETDDLYLTLTSPAWVGDSGPVPMTGVDRFYIPAKNIGFIQIIEPTATA